MKWHANMQGYIESEQAKQQQVAVCVPESYGKQAIESKVGRRVV